MEAGEEATDIILDDIIHTGMDRSAASAIKTAAFRLAKNSPSYNELTDPEKDTLRLGTSIFVDHCN